MIFLRSNEKRKEKSRDAARCRRSRETEIFTELGEVLPLKKEDVEQLDKASVMRLAIVLLKTRDMLDMCKFYGKTLKFSMLKVFLSVPQIKSLTEIPEDTPPASPHSDQETKTQFTDDQETCSVLMEALDGFLMIISNDGDITYVSENIKDYLGINKVSLE